MPIRFLDTILSFMDMFSLGLYENAPKVRGFQNVWCHGHRNNDFLSIYFLCEEKCKKYRAKKKKNYVKLLSLIIKMTLSLFSTHVWCKAMVSMQIYSQSKILFYFFILFMPIKLITSLIDLIQCFTHWLRPKM